MSADPETIHVTLAAAIIVSRGAKTVEDIENALLDAKYILHPKPADKAYKEWQIVNGLTPTTPEQDAAAQAAGGAMRRRQISDVGNKDWMVR